MAIDTFHAESILLRVMKMEAQKGENDTSLQIDMMRTCLCHAADRIHKSGKDTINAFAEGDEERMMLTGLNRFTKTPAYNSKAARRRIADAFIAAEKYHFLKNINPKGKHCPYGRYCN